MIVDASALTAILLREPDGGELLERLVAATGAATHAISIFETAQAVARVRKSTLAEAEVDVLDFLKEAGVEVVTIGGREAAQAVEAAALYGRGRHPAKLNMGDCFSYACAKLRGMPLLYKGEDFARTDLG